MNLKVLGILILALPIAGRAQNISGPILLVGDSISDGYAPYVKQVMPCVEHPLGNTRDSFYLIKKLPHYLLTSKKYAVIHFNVGLWDIAYRVPHAKNPWKLDETNKSPISTSKTDYQKNLQRIINIIRIRQPQAKLIFATTTDVPTGSKGRASEDVDIYNKLALDVMNRNGIAIDDLHAWMVNHTDLHKIITKNKVHYSNAGYHLLAEKVIKTLQSVADCSSEPLNYSRASATK